MLHRAAAQEAVLKARDHTVFKEYGDHRDPHSFPTRRSSDLLEADERVIQLERQFGHGVEDMNAYARRLKKGSREIRARSEEHTSELQSRRDLVCRLLLEKKKHEGRPWMGQLARCALFRARSI